MQDIPIVLGDVIERNARYFPGKTAVVCEERRVTYSEFAARVRKFANALASGGLQPQARFAILAQNCLEYFEAVGAAERAGFIAVTLASVNIFGGFIVTHRMLSMFKKKK